MKKRPNELLGLALLTLIGGQALAEPAAWIGTEAIDVSRIDALAGEPLRTAQQMLYSARYAALQAHLHNEMYGREAAARGISIEQLREIEVLDKVPAMSLNEVRRAMAQRGIEADENESLYIAVARQAFEELRIAEREDAFMAELEARYGVVIALQPPRIPAELQKALDSVTIRHARGPADAKVTIRVFSDYTCGHCMRLEQDLNALYGDDPSAVRIVHHPFPLDTDDDSAAMQAATLAECAAERGAFWPLHKTLHNSWDGQADTLAETVAAHGFDEQAMAQCLASATARGHVEAAIEAAGALNIQGTPVTFINAIRVDGAAEIATLRHYVGSAYRTASGS